MAMSAVTAGQYLASSDIQSREEGCGPVADIVMGNPFHISEAHAQ